VSYSYEKNARFTEDTACWWMPLSALQKRTCDQHRSFRYLLVTHLLDNATDCQRLWGKFRARAPHDNNEFYLCVSGRVLSYLWKRFAAHTLWWLQLVVPEYFYIPRSFPHLWVGLGPIHAATHALYINYHVRDGFWYSLANFTVVNNRYWVHQNPKATVTALFDPVWICLC